MQDCRDGASAGLQPPEPRSQNPSVSLLRVGGSLQPDPALTRVPKLLLVGLQAEPHPEEAGTVLSPNRKRQAKLDVMTE